MADTFKFGPSGGTSKSAFRFSPPSGSSGNSLLQLLQMQELLKKEQNRSLLGGIAHAGGIGLHEGWSGLSWVLDKLSRPAYAVAAGTLEGTRGEGFDLSDAVHGAGQGFLGHEKATFSDVIRENFPKFGREHKVYTALGGLGADVLTDPALPLILASNLIPGVGEATDAAYVARLMGSLGKAGATAAERHAAARTAYKGLKDLGDGYSARKALAFHESIAARAEMSGRLAFKDPIQLNMAREAADLEAEQMGRRVVQARYSIPFAKKSIALTPTEIAGRRVAPLAPSLARTAAKGGVVGKIPGMAKVAEKTGVIFKHGFNEEEFAKPALVRRHAQEQLEGQYFAHMLERMKGHDLSEEERADALHFGETTPGIVQGTGRRLNEPLIEDAVKKGQLTPEQASFITGWHQHMEFLRARDSEFGVKYVKELAGDRLYVPHIYTRDGGAATVSQLAQAGFTKERLNAGSIKAIKEAGTDHAKALDLMDDTMEILATRTRKAARKHADKALVDHMRHSAGIISKVPDDVAREKILQKIERRKGKRDALPLLKNVRGRQTSIGRQVGFYIRKNVRDANKKRVAQIEEINNKIDHHVSEALRKHGMKPTPAWSSLQKMGAARLEEHITHFAKTDKVAARQLQAHLTEVKRLKRKMAKLGSPKGGPAKAFREIADEVARLSDDMERNFNPGLSVEEVEAIGRDSTRENIRYTAQPQGRQGGAIEAAGGTTRNERLGERYKPAAFGSSWKKNLDAELDSLSKNVQSHWNELAAKYPNEKRVAHVGIVKNLERAKENIVKKHREEIERIGQRALTMHSKMHDDFEKQFDREVKEYETHDRKIAHLEQLMLKKFKNNPDIPEGYIAKEIDGTEYYFKPEVHRGLTRVERILQNDKEMGGLATASRKLLANWKIAVTSLNPGYRMRNTMSDLWNMYIAGVPTPQMVKYGGKAAYLQRVAHNASQKLAREGASSLNDKELAALSRIAEMYHQGIMAGLFQGDIQVVSNTLKSGARARDYLSRNPLSAAKFYAKAAQDFNRHAENWGRITHYLYRREYEGLTAHASADWVKRAHFDYEELTPAEQDKFKLLFPFYTWTRKNIPYQLASIVQRPGKYATFPKIVRTSNELDTGEPFAEGEQEGEMPEWMRRQYAFRVPGGHYLVPQIGVADLAKVEHPMNGVLQMLNPGLKTMIELTSGKSLLTGQKISGELHDRNPVSGAAAALFNNIPGSNVGTTSRKVHGVKTYGEGANPWFGYVAGQLPESNFLVNQLASIKQQQRGGFGLTALGYLGGLSAYDRDYESEQVASQIQFQDEMKKVIRSLRDRGAIPENSPKNSKFQLQLQQIMGG